MENTNLDLKEKFLEFYTETCPKQNDIAVELQIGVPEVRKLFIEYDKEIKQRMEIKKIYNAKKDLQNKQTGEKFYQFSKPDFKTFYNWYVTQERKCCYCKIDENVVSDLFKSEFLLSKRDRGSSLELERIQPNGYYSENNCALACYVCNNNKSDFMSAEDFLKYFAEPTKKYLEAKYQEFQAKNDTGFRN